jgi:hypothetical protein
MALEPIYHQLHNNWIHHDNHSKQNSYGYTNDTNTEFQKQTPLKNHIIQSLQKF